LTGTAYVYVHDYSTYKIFDSIRIFDSKTNRILAIRKPFRIRIESYPYYLSRWSAAPPCLWLEERRATVIMYIISVTLPVPLILVCKICMRRWLFPPAAVFFPRHLKRRAPVTKNIVVNSSCFIATGAHFTNSLDS
jgi:hypothetical protein